MIKTIISFVISYAIIYCLNILIIQFNKLLVELKQKKSLKNNSNNLNIDNDFWEDLKNEDISTDRDN